MWDGEFHQVADHHGLLKQLDQGSDYLVGEEKNPIVELANDDCLTHASNPSFTLQPDMDDVNQVLDGMRLEDSAAAMTKHVKFVDPVTFREHKRCSMKCQVVWCVNGTLVNFAFRLH
ncbi:hypothetical protein BDA96_01G419100 [Sorghum bicolor]|jgi:hypothetical protein|uniref:Uncharacterized protein n=1 Tax=Sorghum bicolor TaxID=4558 RepID=A0A921S4R1_SORBI|nr:hypothetical protein BDA96_01G419100 [Sorghum bicolor]